MVKQKNTGRAVSMPAGLTEGALISLTVTLISSALMAKLIDMEKLQWENVGYGIMLLLLAASFAGAITAYGKIRRRRLFVCGISGVIYFCLLLAVTALFFGGQYEAVGVTAAMVAAGSGTAGLLGIKGEGSGRWKNKKRRNR